MRKSLLLFSFAFINLHSLPFCPEATGQPGNESNVKFLTAVLGQAADAVLESLAGHKATGIELRENSAAEYREAGQFLRDIFAERALARGVALFFADSASSRRAPSLLQMAVYDWQFTATPVKQPPRSVRQRFDAIVSIVLVDSSGRVLLARQHPVTGERTAPATAPAEPAGSQPAFARAELHAAPKKWHVLHTGLLALATGATIFLMYSLRSR